MVYQGPERRKSPRIGGRFMVSYCVSGKAEDTHLDVSQTKNIGGGGMLIITNRKFAPGTKLSVNIRLPFTNRSIHFLVKVLESMQVVKDLIYDTRVMFVGLNKKDKQALERTLDYYLKQEGKNDKKD